MRVFHGVVNIGGIGRFVSDYLRSHGIVSDFITYDDNIYYPYHHISFQLNTLPHWQRRIAEVIFKPLFLLFCLWRYTHFNFYFGVTLLRGNLDLPILKLFGKKIIMTYCGSDMRLMEVEKKRNPYCQLIDSGLNRPERDARKIKMMKRQSRWVDRFIVARGLMDSAITVIPRDKLADIWVHNAFGNLAELLQRPLHFNTVPVIIHAPSNPVVKGTKYVEAAIAELRAEGCEFEYRRVTGLPSSEVQRLCQKCDVIVDQLLLGAFGNLAVEGMALGKPVCCYLVEEFKERYSPDCPIVNCTIENLASRLRWLIENPEERKRMGLLGREYVRQHFNAEEIFEQLLEVYRSL